MKALDIDEEYGDRHLAALPMFRIGGDRHIRPFFLVGDCNVIMPLTFLDPSETMNTVAKERITGVPIAATRLVSLLR